MCDCPSDEELFRAIDRQIDARRWQLIAVGFGDHPSPTPWTYTVGLAEGYDHPELVLVGACCGECSRHLLNTLGEQIAGGPRFDSSSAEPVVVHDRGFDVPVHLRVVEGAPLETSWFAAWRAYYWSKPYDPPPLRVVQVVLPDDRGRFPWEPACDASVAARQQLPDWPPEPNRALRRRSVRRRSTRHHR